MPLLKTGAPSVEIAGAVADVLRSRLAEKMRAHHPEAR